jgi:hypothetical protein
MIENMNEANNSIESAVSKQSKKNQHGLQSLNETMPIANRSSPNHMNKHVHRNSQIKQQTNDANDNLEMYSSIQHTIQPTNSVPCLQPHIPLKVHVAHKPTVEDTSRVYNPYPFKNEYEKYAKNGFVFEPLKQASLLPITPKSNSFKLNPSIINDNKIHANQGIKTNQKQINANISFSSEVISPYQRSSQLDNNEMAIYTRNYDAINSFHDNQAFKDDHETEFQNYNNLKTYSDLSEIKNLESYAEIDSHNHYQLVVNSDKHGELKNSNLVSEINYVDDFAIYDKNKHQIMSKQTNIKQILVDPTVSNKQLISNNENPNQYQDEYDIANKLNRKKTAINPNLELINSINEELKRIKTGYLPDHSNA